MFNRVKRFFLLHGAKRMLNKRYFVSNESDEFDYDECYDDYDDDCCDLSDAHPRFGLRPKLHNSANDFLTSRYANKSFADMLNFYMREKDLTSAIIYKRCFIDRRLLSKIVSNKEYHPSKETVFALCIGLRLTLRESKAFMGLAGYAINPNSKYDLLIEYALENRVYDIDLINDLLYSFHEKCFGE